MATASAIKLLALDIDGTLVNSQHELTPATREAIWRAKRAGVEVVLATGRRYSRTLPLVAPLGIAGPLITASGALVKDSRDHQTLFRAEFSAGALHEILKIVGRRGYDAVLYADTFAEGFDYYCPRLDAPEPLLAEFFSVNIGSGRVHAELMTSPPTGVFAGFALGDRAAMIDLRDELQASLPEATFVHVLRSPRYRGFMCEIAPHGINKWSGVRRLAEARGILPEEICAVGDDVNDIPMITAAGLGVAMGNALDEVKAAADRIAPCHDSDGLVEVVNWILE